MSEPPSGRFSVVCGPEGGGAGIQHAIDGCEEGGAILLREGAYQVTQTLRLDRRVHVFGQWVAELRGVLPRGSPMIHSTSPAATLDRLRIDNHNEGYSCTLYVTYGRLRLQDCDVSSRPGNGHEALHASGEAALADASGCTFRGGGGSGIGFGNGAAGRVDGCDAHDFARGSGVSLWGAGTSCAISRSTIRNCCTGIDVASDVDPSWSLGEGNAFIDCEEGDVMDQRPEGAGRGGGRG